MEKLFDETYDHPEGKSRTLWYGFLPSKITSEDLAKIAFFVKSDLKDSDSDTTTSWIFYFKETTTDAIEDTVRESIMIKHELNNFVVHANVSDFTFVAHFDQAMAQIEDLQTLLGH